MIIKNNEINTPLTTIFYDIETDKSDGFISSDGELILTAEHKLAKYVTTGTICFYKNTNNNKNRAVSISDIRNRSFYKRKRDYATLTGNNTNKNIVEICSLYFIAFNENAIRKDGKTLEKTAYDHITGSNDVPMEIINNTSLMSLKRAKEDENETMFIIHLAAFDCDKDISEETMQQIMTKLPEIFEYSFNMKPHLFITATPPHTGCNIGNHQNEVYEYTRQKDFLLRMNFLPADRPCFYIMNTSLHKPFETITDSTNIHSYIK